MPSHIPAMKPVVLALIVVVSACARDDSDSQIPPIDHAPEIKDSIALRARYDVPTPEAEPVIYVDSMSVHYLREEQATVATRDADGHWRVSAVVEEGPGLLKVEQHLVSNDVRSLSDSESHQLDVLLKGVDIYRERSRPSDYPGPGVMSHAMEINTSAGHMVIRWIGRLRGKAGAVADLVIGHG
jgi:hypothetical protein